ncbi:MAG: N-6 DNA methylase [Spirochaetota bacterium]|nr:N-6 DNA methylase [Spirochaetota bacterium]
MPRIERDGVSKSAAMLHTVLMENERPSLAPSDADRRELRALVSKFGENHNEDRVRSEFIDKFFRLLGWDMGNDTGTGEVIRQDDVKISGRTKKPDYGFYIGKSLKFFLEAKKPAVDIKGGADPAEQIRLYGWNKKLPISILTDFEEFSVYNTRIKPKSGRTKKESAAIARDRYYTFREYEEKFDEIYALCSRDAVAGGSLAAYTGKTKGTDEVDDDLLRQIEEWRLKLAKNIYKHNKNYSVFDLNTIVQKIIDRLIFLRIAEDRGIEKENLLLETVTKSANVYVELKKIFKQAITKYNAGMFEKDNFIDDVYIENKELKEIITNLYYPNSPYLFDVLPVEILGSIYERFLGKTIRLTAEQVRVEEKPEVKKAGGVYYTPQYIVDYIVQNTVGEKTKGKTPEEIAEIKICDPACGSGSFLIGAYQYLLDYHLAYYTQVKNLRAALSNKRIYAASGKPPVYKLTIAEKQRILTNSIFGVDIDQQAVEVSKLSLYLKLLEGETQEAEEQNRFTHSSMALLPSLDENIRCGNSFVGTDFYDQPELQLSRDDKMKLNCFDWEAKFPDIFNNGAAGFDVVIGNPPYVNAKTLVELFENERNYLSASKHYICLCQKWDLYTAFMEKSIRLLASGGLFSMIIPYPFLNQNYGALLRRNIIEKHRLISILDLSNRKVFKDAVVTNIVLTLQKDNATKDIQIVKINDTKNEIFNAYTISKFESNASNWAIDCEKRIDFTDKNCLMLGDICFISKGMVLNADEKYAKGKFIKKDLISEKKTAIHSRRYTEAKYMDRYGIHNILYLEWNTKRVPARISRPTFAELYENPKILINKLGSIKAVYDNSYIYCDQTLRVAVLWRRLKNVSNNSIDKFLVKSRDVLEEYSENYGELFLLGIINSRICIFLLDQIRGAKNIDINPEYIKQIPVPKLDLSNKNDKARHDHLVSLVERMLERKKEEATEKNTVLCQRITDDIRAIDNKINAAVYALYGLTEEEIKIVEGLSHKNYKALSHGSHEKKIE